MASEVDVSENATGHTIVTYGMLLGTARIFFAALAAGYMNLIFGVFEPILNLRLTE
jgi:hypothetical protein